MTSGSPFRFTLLLNSVAREDPLLWIDWVSMPVSVCFLCLIRYSDVHHCQKKALSLQKVMLTSNIMSFHCPCWWAFMHLCASRDGGQCYYVFLNTSLPYFWENISHWTCTSLIQLDSLTVTPSNLPIFCLSLLGHINCLTP